MLPTKVNSRVNIKRGRGKWSLQIGDKALAKEVRGILDKNVDWNDIAKSLNASAIGIKVRIKKYNKTVIYDKPPCTDASRVLLEFRFGKPSTMIPVDTENILGVIGIPIMESDEEEKTTLNNESLATSPITMQAR